MKTLIKALAAGTVMLLAAGGASAHGKVRGYVEVRPYYPAVVQVQRHYAPVPVYYDDGYISAREARHARREWRREQWRRDHWRHYHRGHDRCRHRHGRYYAAIGRAPGLSRRQALAGCAGRCAFRARAGAGRRSSR